MMHIYQNRYNTPGESSPPPPGALYSLSTESLGPEESPPLTATARRHQKHDTHHLCLGLASVLVPSALLSALPSWCPSWSALPPL